MPAVQLNVALGEIVSHNSYQLDRGKKTGRNGGVTSKSSWIELTAGDFERIAELQQRANNRKR